MVGVQAEGASPIARAFWKRKRDNTSRFGDPETVASAIRIGNPASWKKALAALKESEGMSPDSLGRADNAARRTFLPPGKGLFVEPASATPIAAMREIGSKFEKDALMVCVATGNGLKDQESIEADIEATPLVSSGPALVELFRKMTD